MANRSYTNFELAIEHDGEHYMAHVLQSDGGKGSIEFDLPFSALEVEVFTLKIGHARRGGGRSGRGSDSAEIAAAKEFGARLFGAVFQGDVYACLRASIDAAETRQQGVRVLLRLPPELANLPWEYLYNPAWNQFFSLSVDTPLVRYLELTPPIHPLAVNPPLRLLVVISSPSDYDPLDVEREWRDLQAALQPLVARGVVEIERLENASLLTLQHQLRRGTYHIFHFIGHGVFDERDQDGRLLFCDEQGRGRPLSGQDLGTLLRDHNSLRLALLNACDGARTAQEDPFAGVAYSLVQMGLPAVIAMQFEISDTAALLFAQEFYTAMADGYGVDAALGDARKAIFAGQGSVEWGTPVLFSRTLDGRIFDLAPALAPPAAPVTPPDVKSTPPTERPKAALAPEIARLYEDGLSAFHLEDWALACDKFQAVLNLRRDYRDTADLLATARAKLTAPESEQKLAWPYRDALQALNNQRWSDAQSLLSQIEKIQPGYRETPRLLEKVNAEIARQKSGQGGGKLLAWLASHRVAAALAGLALIGLCALIFVLTNGGGGTGEPPVHTPGVLPTLTLTPTISPSATWTMMPTRLPTAPPGMALIPAGSFVMGSDQVADRPVHSVTLNAFFMDKYEVTNTDYAKCVAARKCAPPAPISSKSIPAEYYTNRQYANYPVLFVTWDDAVAYCAWRDARLPSEAEWEKAARGGLEGQQYPWGDSAPVCTSGATNGAQLSTCRVQGTLAVGSFAPNGYGLFDMAGNAWEWVNDWYSKSYYNSPPGNNPPGPADGDPPGNPSKVVRGGGWSDGSITDARVANFSVVARTGSRDHVGFRCAASLSSR